MRIALSLACIATLLIARPALAYLLPPESLARLLAEVRHGVNLRDITLQLNADLLDHDHQVDERLYFKRPERARLVTMDDTTLISVEREGQAAAGEDKALKPLPGVSPNLLPILLFPKGKDIDEISQRLLRAMQAVGVDTKVISLGRQAETVCYIIGARAWEPEKAQVWLEKGSWAPVRTIIPSRGPDKTVLVETRLLEYGGGPAGAGMPRVFEEYHDGKLVRRAEVTSSQADQNLPDTMFQWTSSRR